MKEETEEDTEAASRPGSLLFDFMINGWLFRAVAGLVVLFALAACSAASPPGPAGTAEDYKAGGSASEPIPLTGPVPQDAPKAPPEVQRDIVKTATISVTVNPPDILTDAADRASGLATDAGGRIDSRTEYGGSALDRARIALTLRVPADKLDGVIDGLKGLGAAGRPGRPAPPAGHAGGADRLQHHHRGSSGRADRWAGH